MPARQLSFTPDGDHMVPDSARRIKPSILVFRIGSIGDTIVALPAFREIRRRHPGARIVLLTNTPVDSGIKAASSTHILAGMGLVDHCIEYPHGAASLGRLLRVARRIREQAPAQCFYLLADRSPVQLMRDKVFFRLAGIRKLVGNRPDEVRHRPPKDGAVLWESEASRVMRAIGAGDGSMTVNDFSLQVTIEERNVANEALRGSGITGPFLAMSLGSKVKVKDWGDARWNACLAEVSAARPDLPLVAIGSKDEWTRTDQVLRSWRAKTANLCGQLTPRQSAAAIASARAFLCHDSGPMHIANAVNTPLVAIFSARAMPGVWFPFGQEQNVIYRDVPCRGCGLDDCVEHGQRCVTDISPAQVAAQVLQVLSAVH